MTSAEDIDKWNSAVEQFYAGQLEDSLGFFSAVSQSAKIEFNIGFIYMMLEQLKESNQHYMEAVRRDVHLAIAHFAIGLNYYNSNRCKEAIASFEQAKKGLRSSKSVDYKQLGLNFQLTFSEIMLNIGITLAKQGYEEKARVYMLKALESKGAKEYGIINDALDRLQGGYPLTPVQLPYNAIFRPPKSAVDNMKKRDYLGKAKVLFAANAKDNTAGFSGLQKFKERRQSLLQELEQPERKQSLKKCKLPPRKPLPSLGKVVESSPPERPVPRRATATGSSLNSSRSEERRTMFKKRHLSELDEPVLNLECQINLPPPDYDDDDVSETVPERPPKSPTVKAHIGLASTLSSGNRPECPVKPLPRKPPPRPESPALIRKPSGSPRNSKKTSSPLQLNLQFSFVSKVNIPNDCSYTDMIEQVKNQAIPKTVELCYTDDLGRQHTLSEADWNDMAPEKKAQVKFLCFGN